MLPELGRALCDIAGWDWDYLILVLNRLLNEPGLLPPVPRKLVIQLLVDRLAAKVKDPLFLAPTEAT